MEGEAMLIFILVPLSFRSCAYCLVEEIVE